MLNQINTNLDQTPFVYTTRGNTKSITPPLAELMVLAAMCRDSAGMAVNNSRGFTLALIDKYIPLFNCEEEEEFGGQQIGLKQFTPVSGYPNPTDGFIIFNTGFTNYQSEFQVEFSVYDF